MQSSGDPSGHDPSRLEPFQLGAWQVHPDRYELRHGEVVRRLQPRLIMLLLRLVAADGQTVSREVLLDSVWGRRFVNDEVLSRAIADLRQAFDDDARQPWLIETVSKLGYRLRMHALPMASSGTGEIVDAAAGTQESSPSRRKGWALLAVLLAVLLLAVIAVVWFRDSDPARMVNLPQPADFVHARPLVSDPGRNQTPRFSTSGELIAYSAGDPQTGIARIRIRSRDGRVDTMIDSEGHWDICPVFSPDGVDLFWLRHGPTDCRVMRAPLTGGEAKTVSACNRNVRSCPDLSPDGGIIVFTADHNGVAALQELRLSDLRQRWLSEPSPSALNDIDPRFSPMGDRIAFLRGQSSQRSVFIADADGRIVRHLPLVGARAYGLAWLDPQHLIVATDAEGSRALVRIDVHDGTRTLLGAPGARYPDRAVDGSLVWEVAHYRSNLWQIGADGLQRQLTHHQRSDGGQQWSPDGRWLAYQSNREGPSSIWLLEIETGQERRLPLDEQARWFYPAWSPDSRSLLLTRQGAAAEEVWLYRLDSAAPVRVEGIADGAFHARFDASGRHVWYQMADDADRALWRIGMDESASSKTERVETQVASYRIGSDRLVLLRPESSGLWTCGNDGDDCRSTGVDLPASDTSNWTIAGDHLYVQMHDSEGGSIVRTIALDGSGRIETLDWPAGRMDQPGFAIAPDGRSAIVTRGELVRLDIDWLPAVEKKD